MTKKSAIYALANDRQMSANWPAVKIEEVRQLAQGKSVSQTSFFRFCSKEVRPSGPLDVRPRASQFEALTLCSDFARCFWTYKERRLHV